jgi:hypothetical protein
MGRREPDHDGKKTALACTQFQDSNQGIESEEKGAS